MSQSTLLALPLVDSAAGTRWFDAKSCVVLGEKGIRRVFVGGRLVGSFGAKDYAERNVMLIALSEEPKAHLGQLAEAFEVSTETLRELRILVAREGIEAATRRRRGESASRVLQGSCDLITSRRADAVKRGDCRTRSPTSTFYVVGA